MRQAWLLAIGSLLGAAPEVVLLAETEKVSVDAAAHAYFAMGALIGLDRLRALAGSIAGLDSKAAQAAHSALISAFVVTYHALQATRASGDPRAYQELAEAACACALHDLGGDLSKMTLTGAGFAPRHVASRTHSDAKIAQSKRGG